MNYSVVGTTIQTASGIYFDLARPDPEQVLITDIAHALAHQCRFSGHVKRFYSVAEHCVRVANLVPHEHMLAALLHDAPEAYVVDLPTPLKGMLPAYREIERNVERVVLARFDITEIPECVRHADLRMLATERRDLMPADTEHWACLDGIEPVSSITVPLSPDAARQLFLAWFHHLTGGLE